MQPLDAGAGIAIVMDVATGTVKAVAKKNLSENDKVETGSLFQVHWQAAYLKRLPKK
ncbi:MAG: hypothetical protein LBE56_08100 [Tannerella sp.]|jgi:hypothetical protein|nr:hypothetical protein [Tannerella sp.]